MLTKHATVNVSTMQSPLLLLFIAALNTVIIPATTDSKLSNEYSSSQTIGSTISINSNPSRNLDLSLQQQHNKSSQRTKRHNSIAPSTAYTGNHNTDPESTNKGYGPTILVSSDALVQTVKLHESNVIECVHEAEPVATVSWYHNNEPIEIDGHYHKALGSELVFLETKEQDEGIYKCKASNKFGSATSPEFSLSVIKPNKPAQSNQINRQQYTAPKPIVRFSSNTVKGNRPMDIVCEAPDDEKVIWKVDNRQFFAQSPRASDDIANVNFQYSVQDSQFSFNQRLGSLSANNLREYILTMLPRHTAVAFSSEHVGINISCSYQYVKEGASKWINSDLSQLVVIGQDISVKNLADVSDQNTTYGVPINIDMAPPLENLVNVSIYGLNKSTHILGTLDKSDTWNVHDTFVSITRQHFITAILVPTLILISLLMLVIILLRRRSLATRATSAYKRSEQHHKSYHRHYQVPPLTQYPPDHHPYLQNDKQFPYIATHYRSHDLGNSVRAHKTWSLFSSSKKHTQSIKPFMDSRQLSMINNAQCYPPLNGSSRGINLLPRILHPSYSQNNFATAYSTNYIDMRCATPQQNSIQNDQFLASQHIINQQLIIDANPSRYPNNLNNQMDLISGASKNLMYDTPSDEATSTSRSSSSSLTNTNSGQLANRATNFESQSVLTNNNTYLSGGIKRLLEDKKKTISSGDSYSLDQSTFKDSDHHYSTIAEAINRYPDKSQMDACYEDLERHQASIGYIGARIDQSQSVTVKNQVSLGDTLGANDSFRSRISSFLTHQNNSKRNSGASSSTRSSRVSTSKVNNIQASDSTYNQQKLEQPYAITSLRDVTPTPPPPPMSEAIKTLNEQFNLDQLIMFNNNKSRI